VKMLFFYLIACGLLIMPGAADAGAEGLDDSRKQLEEIRRRIKETANTLEEKKAAERALTADLKTVEKEMTRISGRLTALEGQLKSVNQQIAEKKAEAEATRSRIASVEKQVKKRLVTLYKGGETGRLRLLFDPESPARAAENYQYMGRVVRRDRELLTLYRHQLGELAGIIEHLAMLREREQQVMANLRRERETLRQAESLKEALLARTRADRTSLAASLDTLQERAKRLGELIKKLESARPREYTHKPGPASSFARQKGKLPWPAAGRILIGFGTRRNPEMGALHDSQGIEIAAGSQVPIAAVWSGEIVFADWFKGYGNLLILDHGDSYHTLYAQASRLTRKVGDRVNQGDTLGFSGLEGAAGVYFEIRHGGSPLDPTVWLAPRKLP
jgi:murein hydrolase activator